MASLETQVPFMDNDLVDFAMECHVNLKISNQGEVLQVNENDLEEIQEPSQDSKGKQILGI